MSQQVAQRSPLAAGIGLLAELERAGAMSRLGLDFTKFSASYDECEALAALCGEVRDVTAWVIGDILLYSEDRFGHTYPQIAEATGYAAQTLMNQVRVAKAIPLDERVEGLKHGHHEAVAAMKPGKRAQWLNKALKHGWTVADLREHVRHEREGNEGTGEPLPKDLVGAVRRALRDAIPTDDGRHYLVAKPTYERLRALLPEE